MTSPRVVDTSNNGPKKYEMDTQNNFQDQHLISDVVKPEETNENMFVPNDQQILKENQSLLVKLETQLLEQNFKPDQSHNNKQDSLVDNDNLKENEESILKKTTTQTIKPSITNLLSDQSDTKKKPSPVAKNSDDKKKKKKKPKARLLSLLESGDWFLNNFGNNTDNILNSNLPNATFDSENITSDKDLNKTVDTFTKLNKRRRRKINYNEIELGSNIFLELPPIANNTSVNKEKIIHKEDPTPSNIALDKIIDPLDNSVNKEDRTSKDNFIIPAEENQNPIIDNSETPIGQGNNIEILNPYFKAEPPNGTEVINNAQDTEQDNITNTINERPEKRSSFIDLVINNNFVVPNYRIQNIDKEPISKSTLNTPKPSYYPNKYNDIPTTQTTSTTSSSLNYNQDKNESHIPSIPTIIKTDNIPLEANNRISTTDINTSTTQIIQKKKKRGRPRKDPNRLENPKKPKIPKKRGRPRKSKDSPTTPTNTKSLHNSVNPLEASNKSPQDKEIIKTTVEEPIVIKPTSFFPSSDFKRANHFIYDLDTMEKNESFTGLITESKSVTVPYYERRGRSHLGKDVTPFFKFVSLRNVIYPSFMEEYVIYFGDYFYNPMLEIGKLIEYSFLVYLPSRYEPLRKEKILDDLLEAYDRCDQDRFIKVVNDYNDFIKDIPRKLIIENLKNFNYLTPQFFLYDFLHIVYSRVVYLNHRKLKKYKAFSSQTYGELLPSFLTSVYQQCNLSRDHIFMDLGSGVGNCVFQAALEFDCKLSFGCELMESASECTEMQNKEFKERCKLFGLKMGDTEFLLRESFVGNKRVIELLKQCDVLLINNFVFDEKLNIEVCKLIQHLKPGCKIITLKNLKISTRTKPNDIFNRIKVEKFELGENTVSWTDRGVEYFISTVMEEPTSECKELYVGYKRSMKNYKVPPLSFYIKS